MSGVTDLAKGILGLPGMLLKGPETPRVIQPAPPNPVDSGEELKKIKKKKARSGATVLTSPLGLTGTPSTTKKTLLGE